MSLKVPPQSSLRLPTRFTASKSVRRRIYGIAGAAAFSLGMASPVLADLGSGDETRTAVSGYGGVASDAFRINLGNRGIQEIAWEELSDKPCYFGVTGKNPDVAPSKWTDNESICGGNSRIDSRKTVKFKDNPRYFVRGISVCTNNRSNHRLKGIKIYAAKLPAHNSRVDELTVTKKKEHTNCRTWHSPVYCPANEVAFGMDMRVKDGAVVGIALRCAPRT